MNTQIAQGSINELKGELKQTWSKLTDDDLTYIDGGVDQLVGKVQKAYGFTKERATEEFEKFKSKHGNYFRDDRDLTNTKEKIMATASSINGQYDVNKMKKHASSMIEDNIMEPAHDYLQSARRVGNQVVDKTAGLVKENPAYAILGAVTVGFLAGAYFFSRK